VQINVFNSESLKKKTVGLNMNLLQNISHFSQSSEKESSENSDTHKKILNVCPENPYMLKPVNHQRHSVSYQMSPLLEENANTKKARGKINMKQIVERVMTDEEFINKEFSSYKLEKILKPGDTYGEVGMEFIGKK